MDDAEVTNNDPYILSLHFLVNDVVYYNKLLQLKEIIVSRNEQFVRTKSWVLCSYLLAQINHRKK